MTKEIRSSTKKPKKQGGKFLPALCGFLGTLIILLVIVVCLPLTVPRFFGYGMYEVVSGSMSPTIPIGSVIYVKPLAPEMVEPMDIIAYHHNGETVTHRVRENHKVVGEFITKGDANNIVDFDPVPYDELIGRVEYHAPVIGRFMRVLSSFIGKIYMLVFACCGVMFSRLASILRAKPEKIEFSLAELEAEAAATPVQEKSTASKPRRGAWRKVRRVLIVLAVLIFSGATGGMLYIRNQYQKSVVLYDDAAARFTAVAEALAAPPVDDGPNGLRLLSEARSHDALALPMVSLDSSDTAPVQSYSTEQTPVETQFTEENGLPAAAAEVNKRLQSLVSNKEPEEAPIYYYYYDVNSIPQHEESEEENSEDIRYQKDGPGEPPDEPTVRRLDECAPIRVDFEALRAVNPDVVGWIFCPDTPINYPVLHGATNDTYLHHSYDRTYNVSGSIFVDAANTRGFVDSCSILYGHHMNDNSMFASLSQWQFQSYFDEHPVMWLLTPEQDYKIALFSAYDISAYDDVYNIQRYPGLAFDSYLQTALARSSVKSEVELEPEGHYVLMSTCAYVFDNARSVVHGLLQPISSIGGVRAEFDD